MSTHTFTMPSDCECSGSSLHGITFCPLHAAARAMLEALEMLLTDSEGPVSERRNGPILKARAAIRAARGEDSSR